MMKKKGYAKGGMKKKGYAAGGLKAPGAGNTGLKKLPTEVRNKMGYMNKGGMPMKKKAYAKGGKVAMYNVGGMVKSSGPMNTGIAKPKNTYKQDITMAVTLRKYLNNELKAKGLTATEAKKNAGKYKSIAAAKKAGSLYYTDKNGKVMAAVYAEDLKKPLKEIKPKKKPLRSSPFPKTRPSSGSIKVEVLIPNSKETIESAIDKGKNPPGGLRARGLRKLKEKITGKSKGGMAKRKAKK